MRVKRIKAAGIIFCISILFLCDCGIQSPSSVDKIHIGVAYYNQSDTFLNELVDCFKEQINELKDDGSSVTMTLRAASGSQRTQDDQVKELIDAGCNVLCVNLVDRTDPSEIIDLARENNVPVIFFNREPVTEDMMQWENLYYVGADAKQSGVMQGELATEAIHANHWIDRNKDGKIQYVVLEGEPGHQDTIIRTENAVDTLKNNGIELEKLSCGIANWSRAQAQNRMVQIINQYRNKIELVLANNDDMALGALDAYKKLNFTETDFPVFFGIDGTNAGLEAVLDKKLSGTVYNDKEGQAAAMAKLAVEVVSKDGTKTDALDNDKYIYLPYSKVTTDNVNNFLNEPDASSD